MATVLRRDYQPRRPPRRIRLSTGEVLFTEIAGSVAEVSTTSATAVSGLLAMGFGVISGDEGSDGTWILRGPWASGVSYRQNDVVAHGVKSYRATSGGPNLGEPPGDGWAEVSVVPGKPSVILSGSGSPAQGVGLDGEYWLDSAGARLYGPKAQGSWGQGLPLGGQGWTFHTRITTQAGIMAYEVGTSGLPTDERLLLVTLGGIVLSYGAEQDFTFSGSQIVLTFDPGVSTNLVIRAVV